MATRGVHCARGKVGREDCPRLPFKIQRAAALRAYVRREARPMLRRQSSGRDEHRWGKRSMSDMARRPQRVSGIVRSQKKENCRHSLLFLPSIFPPFYPPHPPPLSSPPSSFFSFVVGFFFFVVCFSGGTESKTTRSRRAMSAFSHGTGTTSHLKGGSTL